VTGFFDPVDVDFESRQTFKRAIVESINNILREEEDDCCLYFQNVTVTNVCDSSGNNCLNYMLNSLPEDCGNGVKLDPEMVKDHAHARQISTSHLLHLTLLHTSKDAPEFSCNTRR
jgi:hypothetical protein